MFVLYALLFNVSGMVRSKNFTFLLPLSHKIASFSNSICCILYLYITTVFYLFNISTKNINKYKKLLAISNSPLCCYLK